MPRKRTETVQAGFFARFRDLRVPGPPTKYSAPSTHTAPTPAAWGRPSGRTVPTKNVRSALGVSLAKMSRARLQARAAEPDRSRLRVRVGSAALVLVMPVRRMGL